MHCEQADDENPDPGWHRSGFLVAGWRIIVQIGLALLLDIQDELGRIDTCLDSRSIRRGMQTDPQVLRKGATCERQLEVCCP